VGRQFPALESVLIVWSARSTTSEKAKLSLFCFHSPSRAIAKSASNSVPKFPRDPQPYSETGRQPLRFDGAEHPRAQLTPPSRGVPRGAGQTHEDAGKNHAASVAPRKTVEGPGSAVRLGFAIP